MLKLNNQDITVIILTHNEEVHLERCILSLIKKVKEIIIIDSYSTDNTKKISQKYNLRFYKHKFINHSNQLNWALKNIKFKTNWLFRIDADEITESKFFEKLKKIKNLNNFNGINVKIDHIFFKKKIMYGDVFPQNQIRMWKKNYGYFDNSPMDEKIIFKKPKIYQSNLRIIDNNLKGLKFWFIKHFRYAKKESETYFLIKKNKIQYDDLDIKHQNKLNYYQFPIFIRPILLFFYRYILKKGYLDGIAGFFFSLLQTLYYRILVDCFILKKILFK